jgi:DNA topoisomerase-1
VAVCRKAYVHPRVLGLLTGAGEAIAPLVPVRRSGLSAPERGLLTLLREPRVSPRSRRRSTAANPN